MRRIIFEITGTVIFALLMTGTPSYAADLSQVRISGEYLDTEREYTCLEKAINRLGEPYIRKANRTGTVREYMNEAVKPIPSCVFERFNQAGGEIVLYPELGYSYGLFYTDTNRIESIYWDSVVVHEIGHFVFEDTRRGWTPEMWSQLQMLRTLYTQHAAATVEKPADTADSEFFALIYEHVYKEEVPYDILQTEGTFGYGEWTAAGGEKERLDAALELFEAAYKIMEGHIL